MLDLQDGELELILALEKDRWKAPIGGYVVLSLHLEGLIREISPDLDARVTAQLLLNAVNVNAVRLLRQDAGVELAAIKASLRPLIAGLGGQRS
jgi:hypothetical protein